MDKIPMTIALDMDETLSSFVAPCLAKCRELWPEQQWKLPIYGQYGKWFESNLTEEQREELYSVVKTTDWYLNLPPMLDRNFHGADIQELSETCWQLFEDVKIITFRAGWCPDPETTTREYLRKHDFANVDNLEIRVVDGQTSKLSCVNNSTLFVDDSISVADAVAKSTNHHMLLVNHPWNDGYVRTGNISITPVRRMLGAIRIFADTYRVANSL